ncbi:MAG: hypothetical protein IPP45_02990 [Sphingomonadales bacterium]|nr:hypothetical protein [Sphingomonadales bacterium]
MTDIAAAWRDFCTRLADAGDIILAPDVPDDSLIRAEGFRYLSRLTKLALEQYVEASDPDFPFFYKLSHETAKIGADNPDNVYWNASIRGDCDYRITGKRGSMFTTDRRERDALSHRRDWPMPQANCSTATSHGDRTESWKSLPPAPSANKLASARTGCKVSLLRQSARPWPGTGGEFKRSSHPERSCNPCVAFTLNGWQLAFQHPAQFVRGIASPLRTGHDCFVNTPESICRNRPVHVPEGRVEQRTSITRMPIGGSRLTQRGVIEAIRRIATVGISSSTIGGWKVSTTASRRSP